MLEQIHVDPDIYCCKIPLPGNPLRDLNSYFIVSAGEAMVIDTGFRLEPCREALEAGLAELKDRFGIPLEKTCLFLTHMHADHAGQMGLFSSKGCTVYMGKTDIPYLIAGLNGEGRKKWDRRYLANGYPQELLHAPNYKNPMVEYAPLLADSITALEDGDRLRVGEVEMECIATPGHTPGHFCLYLEKSGILFSGDHILYDITPNNCAWQDVEDSLGDYIHSLQKIDRLPFSIALSAHRDNHSDPHRRIQEILQHHQRRLAEALDIVRRYPGISAYGVAGKMKWSIRAKNWEEFPVTQKWFAMGECLSHLDWLALRRYIKSETLEDGQIVWRACNDIGKED